MGLLCIIFLVSFVFSAKSEKIRCYCNLEQCKSQNDSCSFEDGGCFSDFLDYRNITLAKHGCLHLLDRKRQELCKNALGSSGGPRSLLCCQSDMCNQVLSPVSLVTHPIIGEEEGEITYSSSKDCNYRRWTRLGGCPRSGQVSPPGSLINATESHNTSGRIYDHRYSGNIGYNTNEVWFKAATIAVPICGAMILLMLVALAFKILRTDHVNVEKYSGDANSNANYTNSHIFSFKSNELNPKDLSKKIPLLYEARQFEVRNSEDFRNFTSTRIHYGQNVNILRDGDENRSGKAEKNLENAKMNQERPRETEEVREEAVGGSNSIVDVEEDACGDDVRLEVDEDESRVLATLSLNLDKNDCLNSCNLYKSQRTIGEPSSVDVSSAFHKLYDKYWL